jgi:hypothetical protein
VAVAVAVVAEVLALVVQVEVVQAVKDLLQIRLQQQAQQTLVVVVVVGQHLTVVVLAQRVVLVL